MNTLSCLGKEIVQIWLRIPRWGNYLRFSEWAQCNHKGSHKKKGMTQFCKAIILQLKNKFKIKKEGMKTSE